MRSDVFGFGTILYEMAAGRRAFQAPNQAAVIAAILASDPPPLPPGSPAMDVEWIIRRCLCRNPEDRWQSLGDVAATLKWTARGSGAIPESSPADHRRTRAPMLLAAALLIPAVVMVAFLTRPPREVSVNFPVAVSVLPPPGGAFTGTQSSVDAAQLAISPDGRRPRIRRVRCQRRLANLGQAARHASMRRHCPVRRERHGRSGRLTGTRWDFSPSGQLKRIERRGGPAQVLAPAPNGRGGTWSSDDHILFAPQTSGPLKRVKAGGGGAVDDIPLAMAAGDLSHRWPEFLPDGRHFFVFVRNKDPKNDGIYLAALDSSERTLLVNSTSSGQYAPPGRLLYVAGGTLLSRKLDIDWAQVDWRADGHRRRRRHVEQFLRRGLGLDQWHNRIWPASGSRRAHVVRSEWEKAGDRCQQRALCRLPHFAGRTASRDFGSGPGDRQA